MLLSPANTAPLATGRNVVVVHDTGPFQDPAWYGRAYGTWHRRLLPRLARRARLLIVPSEFVRGELVERFGVAPERVRAIAPGVDPSFAAVGDPGAVLGRLGVSRPYALAVGTDSRRKNLRLLDEIAPALAGAGIEMVIVGSGRPYLPADASPESVAHRLGYVADADLPALYAGAAVFAMPSLYEGFGLPCVEAMAAGAPVVAAERAALPEACAGAALLADPDDRDAFTAALLRAARQERDSLVAAGRARAAGLTWDRTAEAVDLALEPLLEPTGRRR